MLQVDMVMCVIQVLLVLKELRGHEEKLRLSIVRVHERPLVKVLPPIAVNGSGL